MTHCVTNLPKVIAGAAACALVLAVIATPTGRSMILSALVDFVEIAERVVRFPCRIVDHSKCFSLDRFDPTCPQCL